MGPLSPPIALPGPAEYWNLAESATDDITASSPISVVAGGSVTGIDVILNGTPPTYDPFDDCDWGIARVRPRIHATVVHTAGGAP